MGDIVVVVVVEEEVVAVPVVVVVVGDGLIPLNSSCEICGSRLSEVVLITLAAGCDVTEVVPAITKGTVWVVEVVDKVVVG